jgi:hypothetical protein
MSSLRDAIRAAPRFPSGATLNTSDVAEFVHVQRPVSMRELARRLEALPESVPFVSSVVTGTALGGEVRLTVHRDGSYEFSGFMRATGFPSFDYRITAVLRSPDSRVVVTIQHSGEVFGTDTPGDRQDNWDERGADPEVAKLIRNLWPDISRSTLEVRRSSEVSGVLGTTLDVVRDLAELFVAAETIGPGLAVCLVLGSELHDAGASLPGLGGVVGLAIVGGSVLICGPASIVPAIVVGVAVGAVVDAMVHVRPLTAEEMRFADQVFGGSIDFGRVRLTNLSGFGGRAFVAPALDGTILVNIGNAEASPLTAVFPNYPAAGQILIHELTHAWQIEHASVEDGYVPGWICNGIVDGSYQYGPAGPPWRSFGIEAQASIVDQWFGGNRNQAPPAMNNDSSYFRYINGNIRLGEA